MRFRRSSLAIVVSLVAAVGALSPARATDAPAKPAEFVTIGVRTQALPATPGMPVTRLTPLTAATSAAPAAVPDQAVINWKQASSPTSAHAGHVTLSAEQRAKQARIPATNPPAPSLSVKPEPLATILPAPPGTKTQEHAAKPPLVPPAPGASTRGVTAALGVIPRASWRELAASKPQPISTIERAVGGPASPASTVNVQKGVVAAIPAKAAEVVTSAPRDPAAPPQSPDKQREVRP
jgi:hypothetical protein